MKIMILGSGELGKEFIICAQRYGIHTIAVDSYAHAPAMQVSDQAVVIDMKNGDKLKEVIKTYSPDFIVPEIEAIDTSVLRDIEQETNSKIVPSVKAVELTMNRDKIRDYVKDNFTDVKVANYVYASSKNELLNVKSILSSKMVVKPTMSSSGKGQSIVDRVDMDGLFYAYEYALDNSRGNSSKVIIEEFIDFSYEVTILVVVNKSGTTVSCDPIIHYQEKGDYKWSSHNKDDYIMDSECLSLVKAQAEKIAKSVALDEGNNNITSGGIFGVEFFICKDSSTNTYYPVFSELSPRPHDTGMVTMVSQNLSQFELHLRSSILGCEIISDDINNEGGVSVTINTSDNSGIYNIPYNILPRIYNRFKHAKIRFFGKKECKIGRRMGVILEKSLNSAFEIRSLIYGDIKNG